MALNVNSTKLLFHYTRRDIALEHILPEGTLRLGPFSQTNDPREARTWKFSTLSHNHPMRHAYLPPERLFSLCHEESDKIIKQGVKVLCLTRNVVDAPPGWERPRMWSQYGERHHGVCLVFNKERLRSSIMNTFGMELEIYHDSVRYLPRQATCDHMGTFILDLDEMKGKDIRTHLLDLRQRYYHDFFLLKHSDWCDEAEYRWICFAEDDEPRFVNIKDALAAVIVGTDFPDESCVQSECERLRVYAGKMRWRNGYPLPPRWNLHEPM